MNKYKVYINSTVSGDYYKVTVQADSKEHAIQVAKDALVAAGHSFPTDGDVVVKRIPYSKEQ